MGFLQSRPCLNVFKLKKIGNSVTKTGCLTLQGVEFARNGKCKEK